MNCPGHCQIFALAEALLPRAAAALRRVLAPAPQRAQRHAHRPRARPRDGAGRRRTSSASPSRSSDEVDRFFEMTSEVYRALGLSGVRVSVSTRPEQVPRRARRLGQGRADADRGGGAARATSAASSRARRRSTRPKIEVDFRDVLGRAWTLATFQSTWRCPAASACATSGATAASTSPRCSTARSSARSSASSRSTSSTRAATSRSGSRRVQVVVAPITDRGAATTGAKRRATRSRRRASAPSSTTATRSSASRCARPSSQKVPIVAVVGDQEVANGTVTLRRRRDKSRGAEPLALGAFAEQLREAIAARQPDGPPGGQTDRRTTTFRERPRARRLDAHQRADPRPRDPR